MSPASADAAPAQAHATGSVPSVPPMSINVLLLITGIALLAVGREVARDIRAPPAGPDANVDRLEGGFLLVSLIAFTAYVVWVGRRSTTAAEREDLAPVATASFGRSGRAAWTFNLPAATAESSKLRKAIKQAVAILRDVLGE